MKDIKIPIISGLSLAACLVLAPSQVLADKAKAKVDYWQAVEDERQRNSFAKP